MKKDFDVWNERKKQLEDIQERFLFKEGEIGWCAVGLNISNESCGKGDTFRRPIFIVKKLSAASCIGIPLSTQKKTGSWFTDITLHNETQYVLLHQIRMFSTNRFQRRLTTLDSNDFAKVKEKLEALLELSCNHRGVGPGSVGNPPIYL